VSKNECPQPTTEELQKLADMPGYGNAAKVIRKKYAWREFEVDVSCEAEARVSGYIYVHAHNEEDARREAKLLFELGCDLEDLEVDWGSIDLNRHMLVVNKVSES